MNEEHDGWNEPKPIITDKQFVVAVIIAAIIFTIIIIAKHYEQTQNENKTKGQPTYKCLHNS